MNNVILPTEKQLTVNLRLVYIYHNYDIKQGWLRLFTRWYGIKWKHQSRGLTFSERYGYRWHIKIFKYYFGFIKCL